MNLSAALLAASSLIYGAAFTAYLFSFSDTRETSHRPAFALMRTGFLIATFYFAAEAIEQGFFLPVLNFSQAMAFFAWALAFIYLVLIVKVQSQSFGLILAPILCTLTTAAYFAKWQGDPVSLRKELLNPYFMVHIVSAFFAYASFTLSFAAGILYLIQNRELKSRSAGTFYRRLPSLEELERLIYQPLAWGAPLLLAALAIGMFWSKSAFGHYWIFDPKTIATAVTTVLYLVILFLRFNSSVRGRQGAFLSLAAFALVVFSFVGTRFIQGSHNFLR